MVQKYVPRCILKCLKLSLNAPKPPEMSQTGKNVPTRLISVHNNLLIQLWPSSCWPAHRMRIYSNPLINGLIKHTFKINFVFVEKIPDD